LDADKYAGGPNPYFDIMNYGGYNEDSRFPANATCSIRASSTSLSCSSNTSFSNGHGVMIPGAGAGPTDIPTAPAVGTVTPYGVTNGSTTRSYEYVLENYFGALTAAGSAGTTTTSAAKLGNGNTVSITGVVRSNGVDTFTCSGHCNVQVYTQVQITGFTGGGNSLVNGTVVVNSTPTASTFTVLAYGLADYTESASATLTVNVCNDVFPSGSLAIESRILRTWIYRQDGDVGNFNLVGVAPGQDPYFRDCGQGVTGQPTYVPSTAPGSTTSGYLATTITAGGGTTSMTVNNAATTSASNVTVVHDNGPNLINTFVAAYAAHGGVVAIPVIPNGNFYTFPFNSTVDLSSISNPTQSAVTLRVSNISLYQPLVLPGFFNMEGIPQTNTSFAYTVLGAIGGNAHPLLLANNRTAGGVTMSNIKLNAASSGQSSFVADQKVTSGGEVGFIFNDMSFSGTKASAVVIKGGFDFWFNRGVCGVSGIGGTGWNAPPCIDLTNASTYLASSTQAPGRVKIDKTVFSGGTSIQVDNFPAPSVNTTSGGGNINITDTLHESNSGPAMRVALMGGAFASGYFMTNVEMADQVNGVHQPVFEATGSIGQVNNIILINNRGANGNPLMLGGTTLSAPVCINNTTAGCGPSPYQNITGANHTIDGGVVGAQNGASIGYLMATPAAPTSCVVSAGGAVPIGTQTYRILATDRSPISFNPFKGMTSLGPYCRVETSNGQQTVNITRPPLPVGATGWLVWRGSAEAKMPESCAIPIPASTNTFVDAFSFGCGASAPTTNTAFVSVISSRGLNTGLMTINGEGFAASPRAEQSVFLPGLLTTTWTGITWTLDKGITVTRLEAQAKTAPAGCKSNAIVQLTDGTAPVNVTIGEAANDSGPIKQNYAAGARLTVNVQTAAGGCMTNPADVNVVVQYRMQ
jgi:hypothetical protein